MESKRRDELLHSLKSTRSHLINALDGTNQNSNVIQVIDNFTTYLNETPLDQIDPQYVKKKQSIVKGEINCSLGCFTNALKAMNS